ncbi:MAG TPA: hypothetical protein VF712_01355 [Thermoleophilaceae bacterium]|jgi:Tfp pilus assembly protein PilV
MKRLRGQAGMTIVETMVAAVILTAGVLGVFVMVETADRVNKANRGREAATSISREILEKAHTTAFASIGGSNWLDVTLTGLSGGTGKVVSPSSGAARTEVTRRGTTFTVTTQTCSVDDSKDGQKTSTGSVNWCSDSTAVGTGDAQPEDLKRVGVTSQWTEGAKTYTLYHASTFSSAGSVVGPALTEFKIKTPTGLDAVAPTITANPSDGKVVFQATSVGAADMKFTVDGVAQTSGINPAGTGTWTFDWNILTLKDGVYTIGATAIDALGTVGDPQYIQVKLARGAASPVTNVTGGYNDVYVSNVKTRVVELGWDAAAEGSVTGYEVLKGSTTVCSASLNLECMDLNPASNGSTVYTIKTLYTDASGNPGSVSANYTVTAPASGSGSNQFWFKNSATISQTGCLNAPTTFARPGAKTDLPTADPAGTEQLWTYATNGNMLIGCMAPFTAPATITTKSGGFVVSGYFKNTGTRVCKTQWVIYKGTNYLSATMYGGHAVGGSPASLDIPAGTTTITKFTQNLNTVAGTLTAGEQLSVAVSGFGSATTTSNCSATTMYWNSSARPLTATISALSGGGGSGGAGTITRPTAPTALAGTANGDGTTTLTWTPPTGTPAADFYRIYRDGQDYTSRVDTAGETGLGTIQWVDTNTGNTTHVYRVTAASDVFAESDFAGPITK